MSSNQIKEKKINNLNDKIANEMIIKYKINKNENIVKIFGEIFVNKNKKNCKIIYEKNKYNLTEYFSLENINNKKILKIKLIETKTITEMKYMFHNCSSLISIDCIKWNITNIINLNSLFYGCSLLESLSGISNWNTSNVVDMNNIFYNCSSLLELPDISNWNTSNLTNMNNMFSNCSSLMIWDISFMIV